MRASALVGRVRGLSVALGVGAVIGGFGIGVASADSSSTAEATRATAPSTRSVTTRRISKTVVPQAASVAAPLPDGGDTATPAGSAVSSVALAGSRRHDAPTSRAVRRAAATGRDPISTLFFNATPTVSWTQTGQDAAGVVSGVVHIEDPDSEVTVGGYGAPAKGTLAVDSNGTYTYTPNDAASSTGYTDSFEVTVTDVDSGFHIHGLAGLLNLLTFGLLGSGGHENTTLVSVAVAPFGRQTNSAPVFTGWTLTGDDPITGVLTGSLGCSDPDGDAMTVHWPATTAKGSVSFEGAVLIFTPSDAARQNAAKSTATEADKWDDFTVTLTDDYGGSTVVPVHIAINPALPKPTVSFKQWNWIVAQAEGNSGTTMVPVAIELSAVTSAPVTVYYDVSPQWIGSSATAGEDFQAGSGSVTIPAGQTAGAINVAVYGDSKYESDEYLTVSLTRADGATLGLNASDTVAMVNIENDDLPTTAVVSFREWSWIVSKTEGNSGVTTVPVPVKLSMALSAPVTVYYTVSPQWLGSSATSGEDFRAESSSIVIPAGRTDGVINVSVYGDTKYEADEYLQVELTRADGGVIGLNASDNSAIVCIENDDPATG